MRKFTKYLAAVLFLPAIALAQAAATATVTAPTSQPVWLTLLLGLAPWLIGGVIGLHLAHALSALLKALAAKHTGLTAALLNEASIVADDVDAYLTSNGQSFKDLLDPTKRAAAEAALVADAKTEASAAVDAALKRAL